MQKYIQYYAPLLIKFFYVSLLFVACNDTPTTLSGLDKVQIELPSGDKLTTYVAISHEEQVQGLSGLQPNQFSDNEAMLFIYKSGRMRQFWMPDTHFDLDIIFLTKNFYVLDIHRSLKHFPKREPEWNIPISKTVYCEHVLEVKSSSPLAQKINIGTTLKVLGELSPAQIK